MNHHADGEEEGKWRDLVTSFSLPWGENNRMVLMVLLRTDC